MRKHTSLNALFPKTRQGILAASTLHPDRRWSLSDLARHMRVRPSSLQRELAALTEAGILRRRREGGRIDYQADPDCPILPELQRLLEKTAGLADVLHAVLTPLAPRIRVALVHGSIAAAKESGVSDVDLLVIGSLGLADLALPLREAQLRLGREINASVFSSGRVPPPNSTPATPS